MATKTPNTATEATVQPTTLTLEAMQAMMQAMMQQQQAQVVPPVAQVAVSPVTTAPVYSGNIPTFEEFQKAEYEKQLLKQQNELAKQQRVESAPLPKTLSASDLNATWVLCAGASGTLWYEPTAPIVIGSHVISKPRLYVAGTKDPEAKRRSTIERAQFTAWKKAQKQ